MDHHDKQRPDDEFEPERADQGSELVPDDPAYTASREESERVRSGEPPAPRVGGTDTGTAASIGGAVGAAAVGAGIGTIVAGPIGTIVGVIAGALGGWWAGQGLKAASEAVPAEEDQHYRRLYESLPNRPADRSYESVRHAYLLGHVARRNPEYRGKNFDEIEPELERAWTKDLWSRYGDWAGLRGYVRAAFEEPDRIASPSPEVREDRIRELQDRLPESER
jgi:hypothetical protein